MKPKILLTGKTGQIGSELLSLLPELGEVIAPNRKDLDLLDLESIRNVVGSVRPNLIVNAAAFTAVDASESESNTAYAINAEAPAILAEEAKGIGAAVLHYSTDYVFDGRKRTPYEENDATGPINVYGKSKLAGEQAIQASGVPHLIIRTAWVYSTRGRNFLLTILRLATEREELRIVQDQTGSPTWSREVAASTVRILAQLLQRGNPADGFLHAGGTYHMTAGGQTTWYNFAKAILEAAAKVPREAMWLSAATRGRPLIARRVLPISTAEYPTPASRPAYSVLSNSRLVQRFGFSLPDWRAELDQCLTLPLVGLNT
ncbi:MAG TPA: dTDP-4-dehydrorhamnose reductase [Candidatus Acidoferrum sp.]|nr:dTDP-4-dehydrorhamnose reductase [Candidatus Acidoferrum sp.]